MNAGKKWIVVSTCCGVLFAIIYAVLQGIPDFPWLAFLYAGIPIIFGLTMLLRSGTEAWAGAGTGMLFAISSPLALYGVFALFAIQVANTGAGMTGGPPVNPVLVLLIALFLASEVWAACVALRSGFRKWQHFLGAACLTWLYLFLAPKIFDAMVRS